MTIFFSKISILLLCLFFNNLNASNDHHSMMTVAHFSPIVCETGEVFNIDYKDRGYKKALTDLGVVYIEDLDGNLKSYAIGENSELERTKIYRMPILSIFYNFTHDNHFKLKTPTTNNNIQTWAISRTMYDEDSNCTTVSVFELIQPYPILIKNRDPWLYPSHEILHKGPIDIYGIHITAIDQWVAISGYNRFFQRVVAYKKLNYDMAGHNFLMTYGTSSTKWIPNKLYKWIGKKIGISQTLMNIPLSDWIVRRLPPFSQPNILLKKMRGNVILCVPLEGKDTPTRFFNIENFTETTIELNIKKNLAQWPEHHIFQAELLMKKASLNGKKGTYTFSSQEPIDGIFTNEESGEKIEVFKIIADPIDFLRNTYTYVDSEKKPLTLIFEN